MIDGTAMLGKLVKVTVDRPMGSFHPKHQNLYYPVNYGYIEGILAPDGEEQDAYILGVDQPVKEFTGRIIGIVHRLDDIEEKWVVAPEKLSFTREQIQEQIYFQEQYFHSEIVIWEEERQELSMTETRENPARPEGKSGEKMLKRMNRSHGPLRDFGLSKLPWRPDMRVLDVGCGGGATIQDMLKLSAGSVIDGVDYSEVSVAQSKELNQEYLGSRCHISRGDVTKLPFEKNTYDLVTGVETVYFWPEVEKAFREILRVLKPQGMFAVLNEGSDPDQCDWPEIDGFLRIYRPEELETLMKKAGFEEIEIYRGQGQMICVTGRKTG